MRYRYLSLTARLSECTAQNSIIKHLSKVFLNIYMYLQLMCSWLYTVYDILHKVHPKRSQSSDCFLTLHFCPFINENLLWLQLCKWGLLWIACQNNAHNKRIIQNSFLLNEFLQQKKKCGRVCAIIIYIFFLL